MFVSVTRLRLRSWRYLPGFWLYTWLSARQAQRAANYLGGKLLADKQMTYWTMTAWTTPADMATYRNTSHHLRAMPKLVQWCDEASIVHWEQEETELPGWKAAGARMVENGRQSKVRFPSVRRLPGRFQHPHLISAYLCPQDPQLNGSNSRRRPK